MTPAALTSPRKGSGTKAERARMYARVHDDLANVKKKNFAERALHLRCHEYLTYAMPRDAFWFHPTSEGKRTPREGAMLKRLGAIAGIPDLIIFWNGFAFGIELKSEDGRITPAQRATHEAMGRAGVRIRVCRSVNEVSDALTAWGIPNRARVAA